MSNKSKLEQAKNKKWEDLFAYHLQINGMMKFFARDYRQAIPGRQLEIDFADPVHKIGVEIDGGIWSRKQMGHNSGSGIMRDQEKTNLCHMHDWRIFRFNDRTISDLSAIDMLRLYYQQKLNIELPAAGKAN